MRADIKQEWLTALRGGRYKQGTGRLKMVDPVTNKKTHCCLGVLCEIKSLKKEEKSLGTGGSYGTYFSMNDSEAWADLPMVFAEYVGITPEEEQKLMRMNDDGVSFDKIADWIEENL